ncbi:MAG: universal stress protein [Paludibacteraceae bacterium]|nr:universal stress protein [Paludibacteraceae bacterium]
MSNAEEERLITVAIHTFEQAQILKTRLESEGIETYIHNVNLVQPAVSSGVRVRIKESDLPRALAIIEHMNLGKENAAELQQHNSQQKTILVPVDFSDYSLKACNVAFRLAAISHCDVTILSSYYSPVYSGMPFFESIPYKSSDEDPLTRLKKRTESDMLNLQNLLNKEMNAGTLPRVKFSTVVRQGIPEDEITAFSEMAQPSLIVMGTRGKDRKEQELIGSVTAEIIERNDVPTLAIPEDVDWDKDLSSLHVAYATNFDQKDLVAFQSMIDLFDKMTLKVFMVHINRKEDSWDEIKLAGIKDYFKKHYPNVEIEYSLLQDSDVLKALDEYVKEKNIDVISLNTRKRNLLTRIFNPSIARKMIFHAKTPMLIFHS